MGLPRARWTASLTTWSLLALAVGLAAGVVGHATGRPAFRAAAAVVQPVGALWMAALQMTVLPLVISYMLAAILGTRDSGSVERLGARALLLFLVMLVAAGLFTLALGPVLVARVSVDAATLESLRMSVSIPAAARAAGAGPATLLEWVLFLVPRNVFEAAARGDLLPILIFTAFFGVAATYLPDEQRVALAGLARTVADAMMIGVRWILLGTPVAVLILAYGFAVGAGGAAARLLTAFVIIVSALLLLFTALLYPVTVLSGRVSLCAFARGLAPAQVVAISTRSSIASLPVLIESARGQLRLPPPATSFVLPFGVSLFKVNRTISSTAKLLFLAQVYQIPLSAGALATFLITVLLLSFTTVGLPQGGTSFKTLPAYLAAGVPLEGVVILEAVETVPDVFKTLLNVTSYMSVAVILSRAARSRAARSIATRPAPVRERGGATPDAA